MDSHRGQYFHVISRVVDRRFVFGDYEKDVFLGMLRQYEGFTGVQVLSYCLMSNHFHLLLYVPPRPEFIPESEVLKRLGCLYSKDQMSEILEELEGLNSEELRRFREEYLDKFRVRMFHLSHFVRELKLRFSKFYNARNERKGTLWEERFRCSLIEGCPNALMNTAAYIELNPVRAGIVEDPLQYRWCSFTEAVAGGGAAKAGIVKLASGMNSPIPYKDAEKRYREFHIYKSKIQSGSRRPMAADKGLCEQGNQLKGDTLTMGESVGTRVRYFIDGVLVGSREFIEDWYKRNKDKLNTKRKVISSRVRREGNTDLYTYRKVD